MNELEALAHSEGESRLRYAVIQAKSSARFRLTGLQNREVVFRGRKDASSTQQKDWLELVVFAR